MTTTQGAFTKGLSANVTMLESGMFRARISVETIDRDGEVLVAEGCNAKNWLKNPVVCWGHEHDRHPIGKGISIERKSGYVEAVGKFAVRPDWYVGDFPADLTRALVEQGMVKAVSVGFVPLPAGVRVATKGDREKYGEAVSRVFNKWELLEFSFVTLPAHPDAAMTMYQKGIVSKEGCLKWFGCDVDKQPKEPPEKPPVKRHSIIIQAVEKSPLGDIIGRSVETEIARRRGRVYMPD